MTYRRLVALFLEFFLKFLAPLELRELVLDLLRHVVDVNGDGWLAQVDLPLDLD